MKITAQALTLLAISAVANSASGGLRNAGSKNQVTDYDRRLANVPDFDSRSVHEPWLDHYLYSTFDGMSEEEIDAALIKRDTSYPPRQLMVGHDKSFKESACNSNLANVVCEPFESFMADKDPATEEVKIPCGTCVSFDKHDGSTLAFPHGLNVVGKLYIPNDASFSKFDDCTARLRLEQSETDFRRSRPDKVPSEPGSDSARSSSRRLDSAPGRRGEDYVSAQRERGCVLRARRGD